MNIFEQSINELTTYFLRRDAWETWTPTVNQNGAVAADVNFARYIVLAQTTIATAKLTLTAAGNAGFEIFIDGVPLAIQPTNVGAVAVIGSGLVYDNGTALYGGVVVAVAGSDWRFVQGGQTARVGATPNFALANGDIIGFTVSYER